MYILVVDDNALMRELAQRYLELLGYSVRVAETANEALQVAQAASPALAIVDVRLPDQDGPDLVLALRDLPGCSSLPAIAMSGADEADLRRLGTHVDTVFVTKPLELDLLRTLVEQQIGPPLRR